MLYTSAETAKILRKLNEDVEELYAQETQRNTFIVASGEDAESLRPDYDFDATRAKINELEGKIRQVKHALNIFNLTHKLPGFELTVDEALVYIPQLTRAKTRLAGMQSVLPKTREKSGSQGSIIDYRLANFDPESAKQAYNAVSDELARVQTALDVLNSTEKLELEL